MATIKCQLRLQVRELRAHAEALLTSDQPRSDGERSYRAKIVDFTDEFRRLASLSAQTVSEIRGTGVIDKSQRACVRSLSMY